MDWVHSLRLCTHLCTLILIQITLRPSEPTNGREKCLLYMPFTRVHMHVRVVILELALLYSLLAVINYRFR